MEVKSEVEEEEEKGTARETWLTAKSKAPQAKKRPGPPRKSSEEATPDGKDKAPKIRSKDRDTSKRLRTEQNSEERAAKERERQMQQEQKEKEEMEEAQRLEVQGELRHDPFTKTEDSAGEQDGRGDAIGYADVYERLRHMEYSEGCIDS